MHNLYDKWKTITWLIRIEYREISRTSTKCFTGFALTEDGLIMTCAHLFPKCAYQIDARRLSDDMFFSATLVYQKTNWDIALLQIKYPIEFKFCQLAKDGALHVGQTLFHIGNPGNLVASFMIGNVIFSCVDDVIIPVVDHEVCKNYDSTALDITPRYRKMVDIETDDEGFSFKQTLHPRVPIVQLHGLATGEGSSGGPLVNADEEIVGMIIKCHNTYDIAVHVSMLKELLKLYQATEDGKKKHASISSARGSPSKKVKQREGRTA